MTEGGPAPGLALIVGADPSRAILTDGTRHWRFPCPPNIHAAAFRAGESLPGWCGRLWPRGLAPRDLRHVAQAAAEGAFSGPPAGGEACPAPRSLPCEPEAWGAWLLWRIGALAWLAQARDPEAARRLSDRLAHRVSICGALAGPHRMVWLTAPPPLPKRPVDGEGLRTAEETGWRTLSPEALWTAAGLADPAFGILHHAREQLTPRGWLAEAQLYPPPGTLRPGRWPPRTGCCGLAGSKALAWQKAAHEAAERSLLSRTTAAGCAAHPDSAAARRNAGWEAVERRALAAFWSAQHKTVWHIVKGSLGRLVWTVLPAEAGVAVLAARRDGAAIGTAAAPDARTALRAALDELAAMERGGARLDPQDAFRLRGMTARGRAAPPGPSVQGHIPRRTRARDVTPRGMTLRLAVAGRAPRGDLARPRWQF